MVQSKFSPRTTYLQNIVVIPFEDAVEKESKHFRRNKKFILIIRII